MWARSRHAGTETKKLRRQNGILCANVTMSGPVEGPLNPVASLSRDCKSPGMGFPAHEAPPIILPGPDVDVFRRMTKSQMTNDERDHRQPFVT